jgi:hypothetical protein
MSAMTIPVPIEYDPVIHRVETTNTRAPIALQSATRPDRKPRRSPTGVQQCTLLELVQAVGEVTDDDREVVAAVIHLLESGQVRLCGNFRDEPLAMILAS